jgi:hypothetical protein
MASFCDWHKRSQLTLVLQSNTNRDKPILAAPNLWGWKKWISIKVKSKPGACNIFTLVPSPLRALPGKPSRNRWKYFVQLIHFCPLSIKCYTFTKSEILPNLPASFLLFFYRQNLKCYEDSISS